MQKVNFRYSDTNFVAYLMSLGYEFNQIEVTQNREKKLKAFVHFYEDKQLLIDLHSQFRGNQAVVDPLLFSTNLKKISKLIKAELLKFQVANLN
jgi:glutaredoxin-related protein